MKPTLHTKRAATLRTLRTIPCLLLCGLCQVMTSFAGFPPTITTQPTNQTVQLGSNATFVVQATSGTALTYQWYFQSNVITAATNNIYTVTNAQLSATGAYAADVINADGTVRTTNAILLVTMMISGNVFEDVNYSGGAGRSKATSGGAARSNATVELYTAAGSFLRSTNTDATGNYTFSGLGAGTNIVRVVNQSVTSSRAGYTPSLRAVQTFRTDASNGTLVDVTDRVGGEKPAETDAATNTTSQTISTLNAVAGQEVQSLTTVAIITNNLTGLDFGFNFDTIVNTNDSNQGSLRQFILNANALAGADTSIFMISDGNLHPGLRAGLANQLAGSAGSQVARIVPATGLPPITDAGTTIDGSIQTSNVGDLNTAILGTGGTVGVDGLPLSQVAGPEVEIKDSGSVPNGIMIQASNVTIRGLAIYGFGAVDGEGSIVVADTFTGTLIENNVLGTPATSFIDPGTTLHSWHGVYSGGADNGTIRSNLFGFIGRIGIFLANGSTNWTVTGNEIRNTGTETSDGDGITIAGSAMNTCSGNLITGTSSQGIAVTIAGSTGNTFVNNTVTGNGLGTSSGIAQSAGITIRSTGGASVFDRNVVQSNYGAGLAVNNGATGIRLTRNSFFKNGTITNRSGGGPTGQIGIDLNLATDDINFGTAPFVTTNAPGARVGGNNLQNFPVLTSAQIISSTGVTIIGSLNSTASSDFRVEFFVSATANGTGNGEGQRYLGFANLTTDVSGNATFNTTLTAVAAAGEFISATATKSDATFTTFTDTSEFARNVTAVLQADVVTTLSGPTSVNPFTNFAYIVTVTNRGPYAAGGMVIGATLDNNLSFLSASGGGTYLAGVVSWPPLPSLASGATTNFTILVRAPNTGRLTSTAASTSAPGDPDASNNNGTAAAAKVKTTVTALAVANTSSGSSVSTLNWSHTVSPGSSRILIVGLSIDVTNASVVAANFGGFLPLTPIGQTNGTKTKVAMYYLLNPPVGTYPVSVTLSTAVGVVGGAVSLNGVDQGNPMAAFAGNFGTGTTGSVAIASSVGGIVVDTLAPKADNHANFAGLVDQIVAWNLYAANYSGAGSSMPGDITVSPFWVINASQPWAMAAVALNPSIVLADVTLTASGPASVIATSNLTYSITVTNLGLSTATNMVVTDVLPAGTTFVAATGGGTNNAGVITWPTLTNFVNGARTNYTVTITAPAVGSLTNIVYSTAVTADPDPSNNNGTGPGNQVITAVSPRADLATTVTGPNNVFAGTNFTYTITVTNAGPSPASAVVINDTLPAGVIFVSASDAGTNNAGVVTWSLVSLPGGAVTKLSVTVTAPPSGLLTNLVTSTSPTTDLVPANNNGTAPAAQVSTTITPVADVAVTVSGPASVFVGDPFSYTVTVSNLGPSVATSLLVANRLPAGLSFVSASPSGANNAGVVTWPVVASLSSGATLNFTVTVKAPVGGIFTNTVASSALTGDPDPSNNDGSAPAAQAVTPAYTFLVLTGQSLPSGFQVDFNTFSNTLYSLQASTNLLDWATLTTANSGDGHVVFLDSAATNYPQRFYRSFRLP